MTLPTDLLPDDDFDRLARFVSGEASEAERAELARWIEASPARQAALRDLEAAWDASADPAIPDVDAAWVAFAGKLHAGTTSETAARSAPRNDFNDQSVIPIRPVRTRWLSTGSFVRAAAAVVLVLGAGAVYSSIRNTGGEDVIVAAPAFQTGAGEHRTLPLPDGSEVVLGPGSSLAVSAGYPAQGAGLREVTLQGEALFRVTHDEQRPFRVNVGQTVVEDLGTEFVIRGYPADSVVRVVVASGSVAVRRSKGDEAAAVLAPTDVALVRDTGAVSVSRGNDVSRFTAFAEGRLVFSDAPLSEVALELARWYGVEVRIADRALRDRHYTGTFESESLDEVLRVIGMTLDVRYRRGDGWVEFTASGTGSGGPPKTGATSLAAPSRVEAGV